MQDYLNDMALMQRYAMLNRKAMMDELIRGMGLHVEEQFTTIHNYIDTEAMILRKGAVSAKAGEKLLIPIILVPALGLELMIGTSPHPTEQGGS